MLPLAPGKMRIILKLAEGGAAYVLGRVIKSALRYKALTAKDVASSSETATSDDVPF